MAMARSDMVPALLSAACIVLAIALVLSLASNSALRDDREQEDELFAHATLVRAQSILADELWSISHGVLDASVELRGQDLGSGDATAVLAELTAISGHIVNAVTMNSTGHIVNAYPESYGHVIGEYVGDHAATEEMVEFGKPVFSDVFSAVEGFEAAVIAYPVFDADDRIVGSVTALFRTEDMMNVLFQGLIIESSAGIMVEQVDGRILYDADPEQVGKYTFEDPLYQQSPSLLELAELVSESYSGQGEYDFSTDGGTVHKRAIWTSVTLHERSWRVLVYWTA